MSSRTVSAPVNRAGGFISGACYPLKALFFTLRHPVLWPYCIIPVLINIGLVIFLWLWVDQYTDQWLAVSLQKTGWLWESLRKAAAVAAVLVKVLACLVGFVIIGNIVALPFNDLLSEQVDRIAAAWSDPRPFNLGRKIRELVITALQEGKRLSGYGATIFLLFLLSFIPGFAPFTTACQLFVTATFLATDYLSYPLERRGLLLFKQKKQFVNLHLRTTLGFGAAMTGIALIPLINFLFLPLGVVGGTLLFADLTGQKIDRRLHAPVGREQWPEPAAPPPPPPPPPQGNSEGEQSA